MIAGASRFVSAFDAYNSKEKLVLFSGDLFFPSNLSIYYDGDQMLAPFNRLNTDVSCYGNHEFDAGVPKATQLVGKTNCPWILTNFVEKDHENNHIDICDLLRFHVMEHQGHKIGFLGFADDSWLDGFTLEVDTNQIVVLDYNETLQKYSKMLREEMKCDFVFALNHVRNAKDKDMAHQNKVESVDMIFGGHDHDYWNSLDEDTGIYVVKSGYDFECFSNVTVLFGVSPEDAASYKSSINDPLVNIDYSALLQRLFICEKVPITTKFEPDQEISQHIHSYADKLNEILDKQAGYLDVEFDNRLSRKRTQETNLGNWLVDIITTEMQTDFGIMNSRGLKGDKLIHKGPLTYRFIGGILP